MAASSVVNVPLTANVETPVIGPNPKRKAITFCTSNGTAVYFRPDPLGNVAGGIPMVVSSGVVTLTKDLHGDLVECPWWAFTAAGAGQFATVIETIY